MISRLEAGLRNFDWAQSIKIKIIGVIKRIWYLHFIDFPKKDIFYDLFIFIKHLYLQSNECATVK